MAILGPIVALLGRFVGKILTTTLGWASTLLFGRVPQSRQVWLAVLTFGSLVWVVLLVGIIVPDVGSFLLAIAPLPDWIDENLVRLAMLAAAIVLPALVGLTTLLVTDPAERPKGLGVLATIPRGYLLTPALAGTLVVLAVAGVVRKARALLSRHEDVHLAVVVRPGRYDALVATIEHTLSEPGLVTARRPGSKVLTVPAKLLARVAGSGIERLVPDELAELHGPSLTASVYPSDLAMTGSKDQVAKARALISRDVRSEDAWFTTTKEAQDVEDRLAKLEQDGGRDERQLAEIDRTLLDLVVEQDEWEVLYRRRLQLVAGAAADLPDSEAPADQARTRVSSSPGRDARPVVAGRPDVPTLIGVATSALVILDLILALLTRGPRRRRVP